jgi:sterol desaturase/sphingolipid hydroxylase (fatty acid hydroxylase superfamily)
MLDTVTAALDQLGGFFVVAGMFAFASSLEPIKTDIRFNVLYFIVANLFAFPLQIGAYRLSSAALQELGGGAIPLPANGWALVGSIVAFIILNDFLEYGFHFLQHKIPVLWSLHSLHHSEEHLNATTSLRHHWVDALIRTIFINTIMASIFSADTIVISLVRLIYFINHAFAI